MKMKYTGKMQIAAAIGMIALMTLATVSVAVQAITPCHWNVMTWGNQNSSYPTTNGPFQNLLTCLSNTVPTPHSVLGYDLASNGTFTPWAQIVNYFMSVANSSASSRVKVYRFGYSDYGRPMIIGVVTSPTNWSHMTSILGVLSKLSDPEHTTPAMAESMIAQQYALPVVWFEATQHSGESGSAEAAMEMLYLMAASSDPDVLNILNKVIFIINPAQNPDGHDMWVAWHYQYSQMSCTTAPVVGGLQTVIDPNCGFGATQNTAYYTGSPPWWSKYVSHDNNRDWFQANLIEDWNNEQNAFLVWHPQIFEDHHEDSGINRIYTPPDPDNLNPDVSPIIRGGWNSVGMHIAEQAAVQNLPGFGQGYSFDMWYPGYGDTWPSFHNAVGMTFEIARAWYNLAPGLGGDDTVPFSYERLGVKWNYQYPWCAESFMQQDRPNGHSSGVGSGVGTGYGAGSGVAGSGCYWTLEDNNNYQESATWSDLEYAAAQPAQLLWSYYMSGYLNVQWGTTYPPYAFVVAPPTEQVDPGVAAKMLEWFITQGVEVNQLTSQTSVSNACSINSNYCAPTAFPAGSYIIRMNQPLRGYIKTMLELQDYPHNVQDENGNYISGGSSEPANGGVSLPYDVVGWTKPLTMGVTTYNVTDPTVLSAPMSANLLTVTPPAGGIVGTVINPLAATYGYAFTHNMENSLTLMNRLMQAGYTLYEAATSFTQGSQSFQPGTVILPQHAGLTALINTLGKALYVPIYPIQVKPAISVYAVTLPKIGVLYSYSSTMDEGWTRWLLDHGPQYSLPLDGNRNENEFTYTRLSPLSIDTGYINDTVTPANAITYPNFNVIIIPPGVSESSNSTSRPQGYQTSCTSIENYAPELGVAQFHIFASTYTCPQYAPTNATYPTYPGVPVPNGATVTPVAGEQLSIDWYGVANLNTFIQAGGTVICEDSASSFCDTYLGGISSYPTGPTHTGSFIPLAGVTKSTTSSIYGPGLVVQLTGMNASSPLAFGYPNGATAAFWESSSAWTITSTASTALANYPAGPLISVFQPVPYLSGYIYDPNNQLAGHAAAVLSSAGNGHVVLLGFRAIERAQADATFMMYFDAIYFGTSGFTLTTLP